MDPDSTMSDFGSLYSMCTEFSRSFCESIFKEYGFDFNTIKKNGGVVHSVGYTESVALMKDGQADVFMAATSVPQASFIELENSPGIRFIALPKNRIDNIVKNNPGYIYGNIPASAYKSLNKDVPSLGIVTRFTALVW